MKGIIRRIADNTCVLQSGLAVPIRKPGHVLIKNQFSGVNFIDTYYRDGLYPSAEGAVLGAEAGGVVTDCDDEVKKDWMNEKVVFFGMGGFAEYTSVPITKLVRVPDDVTIPTALALTTMGLTAHYLCASTAKLKKGEWVLVHAAGSGTGRLIAEVASNVFGANVVGTCSTRKLDNVPLPRTNIIDYTGYPKDLAQKLRDLTPNKRGFDVVFDGVGKDTAACSLDVCRARGLVVYFGNASGPVPPINPLELSAKGSLFVTRPKLPDYVATQAELSERSTDLFSWLKAGQIHVTLDKEYASLDQVNDALDYIKSGKAAGKVVVRVS
jgi:NADPH2:quinone reductase